MCPPMTTWSPGRSSHVFSSMFGYTFPLVQCSWASRACEVSIQFPKLVKPYKPIKWLPRSDSIQSGILKLGIKSFRRCFATSLALRVQQGHAIGQFEKPSMATSRYSYPLFWGSSVKSICHTYPSVGLEGRRVCRTLWCCLGLFCAQVRQERATCFAWKLAFSPIDDLLSSSSRDWWE